MSKVAIVNSGAKSVAWELGIKGVRKDTLNELLEKYFSDDDLSFGDTIVKIAKSCQTKNEMLYAAFQLGRLSA